MKTQTQHTPGPWNTETCLAPDELGNAVSIGATQEGEEYPREIAIVVPHEDMDANARLIASAPDLLAALEDIITLTDTTDVWLPISWRDDARAAIAKAKGVQS